MGCRYSYHDRLAEICQSVEMVDEVQVKKGGLHTEHRPPVMRPMSAARGNMPCHYYEYDHLYSVVVSLALSTRQVQEQIVHMERELESVQRDLESRFCNDKNLMVLQLYVVCSCCRLTALTTSWDLLLKPSPETGRNTNISMNKIYY